METLDKIFAKDGAIKAFEEYKKAGKAKFLGITGHDDPLVHSEAIKRYDFDTVLMPIAVLNKISVKSVRN